jgi:hypothetical protein
MAEHDIHSIGSTAFEEISIIPHNILLRNTTVVVGDIRITNKLKSNLYLECTTAGTTGSTPVNITSNTAEGNVISDGSAVWTVRRVVGAEKWGTARNVYIKDADGTNTSAAVSVDGSGTINLKLPATIKANVTGNVSTATKIKGKTVAIVSSFDSNTGVLALTGLS